MLQNRSLAVVLLGVGLSFSACLEKKKPETVLKGEVGEAKVSAVQDLYFAAKEEKKSSLKLDRRAQKERERWKLADRRRSRWITSAMESGYLESDYSLKEKRRTAEVEEEE